MIGLLSLIAVKPGNLQYEVGLRMMTFLLRATRIEANGDVSPLILREANNQEIDISSPPKIDLNFRRAQDDTHSAVGIAAM